MPRDDETKKSWTYKKPDGSWEIQEPIIMMDTFFNNIVFKEYDSKDVYVLGFSQGAAACYEYIMGMSKPFGGIFPIGGFFFKDSLKNNRMNKNKPRRNFIKKNLALFFSFSLLNLNLITYNLKSGILRKLQLRKIK